MNRRTVAYISLTCVSAIALSTALYWSEPAYATAGIRAVVLLSILALIAEALGLLMPHSVTGSLAFIPYLSAALIVPNWIALAGAVAVRTLLELASLSRRTPGTPLFNVAQQAVTFSSAVLIFKLLGGQSLLALDGQPLTSMTLINGLPAIAAFVVSFAINNTLVLGYVAARSSKRISEVWQGTLVSTIALDILATPIVFMFAWAYVSWGSIAAAALWVPVLGLRQLHKNNLDLERTNSELLELMVKSMEARDPYTSGHSRRVQQFSVAIARGLGMSTAEVDKVGRAALLHDVGKIYEKYAPVLRKPGQLTPDEWLTMQEHPADGAELVSTMSKLHDIVPAIKHHHERWDGTGYPEGLAGETIPVASRIIAFGDTIDAMTSERPYRKPLTEAEVRSELVRCRGTQFDPTITDHILSAPIWRQLFPPTQDSQTPERSVLSLSRVRTPKQAVGAHRS